MTSNNINSKTERSNKSGQLVQRVRERFLEEYERNKDLYDEKDIKRIKENDWYVKRFLLARGRCEEDALVMLQDAMRWRKEFGLTTMKDSDFPFEFYKIGGLFSYEKDKYGNSLLYMRVRMHKKIPELAEPTKRFVMYMVNKVDVENDGNGIGIVFDLSGAGYSNVDMDFLSFLINSGSAYFPYGLKFIYVYELPWLLSPFKKLAMALMPKTWLHLIKFVYKSDITEHIAIENLPDYMGGTCKRNYRAIPKGCKSVTDAAVDYGVYNEEQVKELYDKLWPMFEPLLLESEKALAEGDYIDPPGFDGQNDDEEFSMENCDEKTLEGEENFRSILSVKTHQARQGQTQGQAKLLGLFPNDIVHFTYESYIRSYQAYIFLQNISQSPIAFKVQSNNPNSYFVSPRLGIILANATLKFVIQLRNGFQHQSNDKFLILALPAPNAGKMSAQDFSKLWQTNKMEIVSYKVRSNLVYNKNASLENESTDGGEVNVNSQITLLTQRCKNLELRQQRLSLTINVLIFFLFLLIGLVIFGICFNESISHPIKNNVRDFIEDKFLLKEKI